MKRFSFGNAKKGLWLVAGFTLYYLLIHGSIISSYPEKTSLGLAVSTYVFLVVFILGFFGFNVGGCADQDKEFDLNGKE